MTDAPRFASGPDVPRRVAVIQDGARLHYAVPLAFHQAGMLDRMYTEWFGSPRSPERLASRLIGLFNGKMGTTLAGRRCDQIPAERVVTNPTLALRLRFARRRFTDPARYYEWCSSEVANWVRSVGWGSADTLFGFIRNLHPTLSEAARQDGLAVVADQMIAPARIEHERLVDEQRRWPNWADGPSAPDIDLVDEIEQRTWQAAQRITCASDFVRDGLIERGVPAGKISVIPYPIRWIDFEPPRRLRTAKQVTVGFVGAVSLRKGAPYFLAVARRLAGRGIRFVMVGPVLLPASARDEMSQSVELAGSVPRSQVTAFLGDLDIFLFPSTCEGSAGAVMEAMAAGLPIVTTPSSGSLVVDGVHGFVRPHDDVDGLVTAVERLVTDPELRSEMGKAAQDEARRNTLDRFARHLKTCLNAVPAARQILLS